MNVARNPKTVAPPFGKYSHSVEAPAGARTLYVAGQVGVKPDGSMAQGIDGQCEWAWKNLVAVLMDAGMGVDDVVKINIYLTDADHVAAFRAARDAVVGDRRPAATLAVIKRLAAPDWLVEIEAVAAK
jgi:enamine deaminase RidA (YjgF/YER057c/UK114 family)